MDPAISSSQPEEEKTVQPTKGVELESLEDAIDNSEEKERKVFSRDFLLSAFKF
jgi:hypothetical protein